MNEDMKLSTQKKILIVTALSGFIRSFLTHDIQILQDMGYEVHCAANSCHPGAENIDEYFKQRNVVFHQIDFSSNKPLSRQTAAAYGQMKQLISKIHFDAVHCHTPIAGAIARWACRKQRARGMKVLYTTHGFYFHKGSSWKTWAVFRTVENLMSLYCDAIVTINQEDYAQAQKMHARKVYHINGVGVDLKKFRDVQVDRHMYRKQLNLTDDDIVVLAVGELSQRKNQRVVIEAIGLLNDPRLILVHCGNAMTASATTDSLVELAESSHVRLRLMGLRKDIPQICKCADIGTISSTREGLGLAGIEMLASGLPVVASDVHGILDYMQDGVNGYLADPYSPQKFAEGIRKLMDPAQREKMQSVCENSVEKFDISVSYAQMDRIYREVLG